MRLKPLFFIILSLSTSNKAYAQEQIKKNPETNWTIGISGGATAIEGNSDQHFGSFSVSRDFGDAYAGISLTHVDSGDVPGLINAVPASTTEVGLNAGTSFEALSFDVYLSVGKRNFDVESIERNGLMASISSSGNAFGIGGAVNYDIPLSTSIFLTPSIAVDYNELDTARIVQGPTGQQVAIENNENGVTGTFGLAAQKIFGNDSDHVGAILANVVTTSNTTSFNPGTSQSAVLRALATRDQPGQKDSWAEIGGAVSLAVAPQLRLDISALQTIGFLDTDATSVSVGLRYSF
ncbi:autotransporter domain-containing protein [Parasphingorhabdus sp.]|uniref:autotransporter domain-containing protein n=1 Tax=Parasphingorhabdus sp. TaxID=2709688 RepID=UPI0032642D8E